jgi:hypothetical protein
MWRNGRGEWTLVGSSPRSQDTDYEKSSRIDWATLLRRVYDIDVLACPCGGRLEMLELVTDKAEICAALDRLHLDDEPPDCSEEMGDPRIRGPWSHKRRAEYGSRPGDPDGLRRRTGALGFAQSTPGFHREWNYLLRIFRYYVNFVAPASTATAWISSPRSGRARSGT